MRRVLFLLNPILSFVRWWLSGLPSFVAWQAAFLPFPHPDCRDNRPFLGLEVCIVCLHLGQPRRLEAVFCEFRKRRNQARKGAADGEFSDAVLFKRLCALPDLVVPDVLAEVYLVVACCDAVAVCPE